MGVSKWVFWPSNFMVCMCIYFVVGVSVANIIGNPSYLSSEGDIIKLLSNINNIESAL